MIFDTNFITPALLGFFSGLLPPLIIEKWKGSRDAKNRLTLLEVDVQIIKDNFKGFSAELDKRLIPIEEKVRALEVNLSHNTGVLKATIHNAPLEDTTTNIQTSSTSSK